MSLWGTTHDAATNKPKFLSEDENSKYTKGNVYATQAGWVVQAGSAATGNDNTSSTPEVLVAIGGLAGATDATGLRAPTTTDMRFVIGATATTDLTAGGGANSTVQVEITWDEAVTVVGSPTLAIANGNQGAGAGRGPYTLVYTATGSTANRKRFTLASQTIVADDILTIGGANIVLAGGTISDTVRGGTAQAASLVLSGLTAVTHTVLA